MSEPIVNPTREQRLALKGIIYGLIHRESGMAYVGQTVTSFNKRYKGGNWWRRPGNRKLADAISRFGVDSFDVMIFEHSITDRDRLDELEEAYAERLQVYGETGFNVWPCGFTGRTRAAKVYASAVARHHQKQWRLKWRDTGEVIEVTNLSAFCREHGLNLGNVHRMLMSGRGAVSCGLVAPETTEDDIANVRFYRQGGIPHGPYILWREGVAYPFSRIEPFCQLHSIDSQHMCALLRGDIPHWKRFTLHDVVVPLPRQRYADLQFVDSEGRIQTFSSVREARQALGMGESEVLRLVQGRGLSSHGYRLLSFKRLPPTGCLTRPPRRVPSSSPPPFAPSENTSSCEQRLPLAS